MSNTYYETDKLSLCAFMGKERILQITIKDGYYIQLTESESLELATNILLRVGGHITATGIEEGIEFP